MAVKSKYDVGSIHVLKNGDKIEVVHRDGQRLKVRFLESDTIMYTHMSCIYNGVIRGCRDYITTLFVGDIFTLNNGESITITEILPNSHRRYEFNDEFKYSSETSTSNIKSGKIFNPYRKNCFGVGYLGTDGSTIKEIYTKWSSMLRRCYSEWFNTNGKNSQVYSNTIVCKEWHNYSNFEKWYLENYPNKIEGVVFNLDKDLLQDGVKNKVYSPDTCVFLPAKVNTFLCNNQNTNKTGRVGVNKVNNCNRYRAQIKDFEYNKKIHLGLYKTIEEASNSYIEARKIQIEKVIKYLLDLGITDDKIHKSIKNSYPKYGDVNG